MNNIKICINMDNSTIDNTIIDIDNSNNENNYIEYLDKIVNKILNMKYGETIMDFIDDITKKQFTITKNIRFKTYIFSGYGSKKILKYFIEKTQNNTKHNYKHIIQITSNKNFRRYLPIKNWFTFWNIYKNEPIKSRYLFEMILSKSPCKPYLDIEWTSDLVDNHNYLDNHNDLDNHKNYDKFIKKLIKDIKSIFVNRYNITLTKSNILISTAHSEKKASFHIVINKKINKKLVCYETNRKGYANSAWDLWHSLVELDESYKNVLDESVYSRDREFRVIFSNKYNQFRPFVPYKTNINENTKIDISSKYLKYLITYTPKEKYIIKTPKINNKNYMLINKNYIDEFCRPIHTDTKINYILKLLQPYHRTANYTGQSSCGKGWRFSYYDKNELCYTGNIHKSNGFYVFENREKGILYMKCMSKNCTGIQVIEKYNNKKL
jgi:hypothetical protein